MTDFIIKKLPYDLNSQAGLAFIGKRLCNSIRNCYKAVDIAACYIDPALAAEILDWHATRETYEMCADSWRWQQMNPNGYLNA